MEESALVTGATGFVGSHMVEVLLEKGIKVYATDLPSSNTTNLKSLKGVEFIPADLTKPETLTNLPSVDYIFHPAAIFHFSTPWEVLRAVNVEGTRNLLEKVLENKRLKRFVNWSTTGIYGLPSKDTKEIDENSPASPSNNYERSKWMQEEIVREYADKYNIPTSIVRPSPIYGPRSKYGLGQLIMMVAEGQIQCSSIFGKSRFPAVHVKDVCEAAYFISQKESALGEAYILVDDQTLTVEEVPYVIGKETHTKIFQIYVPMGVIQMVSLLGARWSETLAKIMGWKEPKIEKDPLLYIAHNYYFHNKKIKELGYKFLYPDTKVGLIETISWYKKEGWIRCPEE